MSVFSKAMNIFRKKDYGITTSKEDRIFWQGVGQYGHKEFSQVAAALRAGYVIAGGMGMMPVRLEKGDGEQRQQDQALKLINDQPNDLLTGVEFREMMTLHAVFTGTGRAYIHRRSGTGEPIELWPLLPSWSASGWVFDGNQYVLPVSIENEGFQGDFTRDDILEITGPRWDMLSGMNATNTCSRILGLSTQLQDRQARLADGNAPYGVLTAKEGTSDGAIKKLKESWSKQFGQSGIAVVDFEAQFSQLMQTPQDQQLLDNRKFQVEEIARLYGVHPYFLMQTSGSGAQGAVSDAMLFHLVYTMGPWIQRWEAALNRSLFKRKHGVAAFDENVLMRTTPQIKAEMYAKALGAGGNKPWMTENEVRQGKSPFKLPDHKDGNDLAIQKGAENEPRDEVRAP